MTSRSRLRSLFVRPKSSPVRRRPRLEALEDRLVPAAYHVSSLLDDGSAGTLREAITQTNANPGPDTIDFQVAGTIALCSGELGIHDAVTITGPGAANLTINAQGAIRISGVMQFPDSVQRIKAVSTCGPGAHSWGNPLRVVLTQNRGSLGTNDRSRKGPLSRGR
jgi:hypothetical protein